MRERRLGIESLESRQMLAGNVSAAVVGGELRLTGDGAANWVQVTELPGADGTGRTFRVQGKPFDGNFNAAGVPLAGAAPTTINGGTAAVVRFAANDKVRMVLGGGNDALFFGTATSDSSTLGFVVNTGAGRDYVKVQRMAMNAVAAPISINTGVDSQLDNEVVQLIQVSSQKGMTILTGGGNDRLLLNQMSCQETTNINLGAGADTINGTSLNVNFLTVNAGTSNHRDVINVGFLVANSLSVTLGGGNDLINLTGPLGVSGNATINGGAGTDELRGSDNATVQGESTLISIEIDDIE